MVSDILDHPVNEKRRPADAGCSVNSIFKLHACRNQDYIELASLANKKVSHQENKSVQYIPP